MKEQIIAVQKMQDYIAKHMEEEITMADLANVSLFSPWYSYRLFRQYTGITVAEYIRKLRLSESAVRLKKCNCKVTEVAYEMGYESIDGYQRAFRNAGEYAKDPVPISLFIPYGVKFRELRKEGINMENLQSVFVQVVKKPERRAVIKRGVKAEEYFAYCEEVGCDTWGLLLSMDSMEGEPVCLWLPDRMKKKNTSTYVQGVVIGMEDKSKVPEGFDEIILPECEYLMFQGEPFTEENYCEAIQAVQHAMNKYDPSIVGYEWDDENPRIQLEPRGERGYIEMRAVKRK